MSLHLNRSVWVGYNPAVDRKWLPIGMSPSRFYPVFAYENGTLKMKDGTVGEAVYFHFIGDANVPCRLIRGSAVLVLDADAPASSDQNVALWKLITAALTAAASAASKDDFPV